MRGTVMGKKSEGVVVAESSSEWTNLVQTRISPKAKAELERQMEEAMSPSQAHFLRMLIYRGLGLVVKEGK